MKVKSHILWVLVLGTLTLAFTSPVLAVNLYTSSTGSDAGNNCQNIASPCNLANGLANELAQVSGGGGDTIYMCAGACDGSGSATITFTASGYFLDSTVTSIPSGTGFSDALTITVYPGETITLQPLSGQAVFRFFKVTGLILSGPNLILDGINLNSKVDAVVWVLGNYERLTNLEVKNGYWTGIGGGNSDGSGWTHDQQYINLTVHNNGRCNMASACNPAHGIYLSGGATINNTSNTNDIIDGGTWYSNNGWNGNSAGIECYTGTNDNVVGITIRNAKVHDNDYGMGIAAVGCSHATVYNNVIYNNNVLQIGIGCGGTCTVYNNTVYGHLWYGVRIDAGSGTNDVRNNIFYSNSTNFQTNAASTTCSNNIGLTTACSNDSAPPNPLFLNSGVADFHLQNGSPAIGTGATISVVTTDISGTPRPAGAYDRGAYQSGSVALLSPPTNLRIQ